MTAATAEPTPAPQSAGEDEGIDVNLEIVQVEELQNHGINMSDIQKLKGAGIHSISVLNLLTYLMDFMLT
jgi:hypothetical protein